MRQWSKICHMIKRYFPAEKGRIFGPKYLWCDPAGEIRHWLSDLDGISSSLELGNVKFAGGWSFKWLSTHPASRTLTRGMLTAEVWRKTWCTFKRQCAHAHRRMRNAYKLPELARNWNYFSSFRIGVIFLLPLSFVSSKKPLLRFRYRPERLDV